MADDKRAEDRRAEDPDREWGYSDLFETAGHRPRPRLPDPVTGKMPETRPPKGGSSVLPPGSAAPKAPPKDPPAQ